MSFNISLTLDVINLIYFVCILKIHLEGSMSRA